MTGPPERRPAIYPARRALERTLTMPGARPVRVFALLLPVFCLQITADVTVGEPYQLIERFLERAILDCRIVTGDGLARFFGLDPRLVERVLAYLEAIGHLRRAEGRLELTDDLGVRSVRRGKRLSVRRSSIELRFEGLSLQPFPRDHYAGDVRLVPGPVVEATHDGTRFDPLSPTTTLRTGIVWELLQRPDRERFNVPPELHDVQQDMGIEQQAYLPFYLVQSAPDGGAPRFLAFSRVDGEHDEFLEDLCRGSRAVQAAVHAEGAEDPGPLWSRWLARAGHPQVSPYRHTNGVWRADLPPDAFGEAGFPITRLGSFELQGRHFIQLWCRDEGLRRDAVIARGLQVLWSSRVRTRADLEEQMGHLRSQLGVDRASVRELRAHAAHAHMTNVMGLIDHLP